MTIPVKGRKRNEQVWVILYDILCSWCRLGWYERRCCRRVAQRSESIPFWWQRVCRSGRICALLHSDRSRHNGKKQLFARRKVHWRIEWQKYHESILLPRGRNLDEQCFRLSFAETQGWWATYCKMKNGRSARAHWWRGMTSYGSRAQYVAKTTGEQIRNRRTHRTTAVKRWRNPFIRWAKGKDRSFCFLFPRVKKNI